MPCQERPASARPSSRAIAAGSPVRRGRRPIRQPRAHPPDGAGTVHVFWASGANSIPGLFHVQETNSGWSAPALVPGALNVFNVEALTRGNDVFLYTEECCGANGVYAYRIEHEGRSLVYATDTEHYACVDPALRTLAEGADVLVYDAQYTPEEYRTKVGWGHSTYVAGAPPNSGAPSDG